VLHPEIDTDLLLFGIVREYPSALEGLGEAPRMTEKSKRMFDPDLVMGGTIRDWRTALSFHRRRSTPGWQS
jgi:hypothetical protein